MSSFSHPALYSFLIHIYTILFTQRPKGTPLKISIMLSLHISLSGILPNKFLPCWLPQVSPEPIETIRLFGSSLPMLQPGYALQALSWGSHMAASFFSLLCCLFGQCVKTYFVYFSIFLVVLRQEDISGF